eukprot:5973663-Pleurochrysis_carterae.AAC.3
MPDERRLRRNEERQLGALEAAGRVAKRMRLACQPPPPRLSAPPYFCRSNMHDATTAVYGMPSLNILGRRAWGIIAC